jgi:protein-disulfide isomerase
MVLCRIAGFTESDAMAHQDRGGAASRAKRVALLALLALAGCASSPPVPDDRAARGDFKALGRADAPVTLVEFTDLQCPYCARFAEDTFPALRRKYIDTGRLQFLSRDLPMPFHAQAVAAAVAARCAGEQAQYWPFREALLARQGELPKAPYDDIARRMKLDLPAFEACRAAGVQEKNVREDAAAANAAGLRATPSFLLGRTADEGGAELIEGAQPLEVFERKIDALLKKK